jgi:hypothetical protein
MLTAVLHAVLYVQYTHTVFMDGTLLWTVELLLLSADPVILSVPVGTR